MVAGIVEDEEAPVAVPETCWFVVAWVGGVAVECSDSSSLVPLEGWCGASSRGDLDAAEIVMSTAELLYGVLASVLWLAAAGEADYLGSVAAPAYVDGYIVFVERVPI